MFVLAFVLLALSGLGFFSIHRVGRWEMNLMIPAMIVVMLLRFEEYAGHSHPTTHRRHPRLIGTAR